MCAPQWLLWLRYVIRVDISLRLREGGVRDCAEVIVNMHSWMSKTKANHSLCHCISTIENCSLLVSDLLDSDVINPMCPCTCHHSMSFAYSLATIQTSTEGPASGGAFKQTESNWQRKEALFKVQRMSESIWVNVSISFQYVSQLPLHILHHLTMSITESFQRGMSAPGSAYLRGYLRGTGGTGPYGLCQRAVVATRAWSDGFCRHGVGSTAQRLSWETREATSGALRISGKIIEWYRIMIYSI